MKKFLSLFLVAILVSVVVLASPAFAGASQPNVDRNTFGGCINGVDIDAQAAGLKNPWYPSSPASEKAAWTKYTAPRYNDCSCRLQNRPWTYDGPWTCPSAPSA